LGLQPHKTLICNSLKKGDNHIVVAMPRGCNYEYLPMNGREKHPPYPPACRRAWPFLRGTSHYYFE